MVNYISRLDKIKKIWLGSSAKPKLTRRQKNLLNKIFNGAVKYEDYVNR